MKKVTEVKGPAITFVKTDKKTTTKELVEELKKRKGVKVEIAEPYEDKKIAVNGPATVLVITD